MTEVVRKRIDEHIVPGKRLGRHVEHDPRSKDHPFGIVLSPTQLKTVRHRRWGKIFDQGDLGSCTGNASAGAVNCRPLHTPGGHLMTEEDAVDIYERATVLDGYPGQYPPDDTGSSGLAAAKALVEKGLIKEYSHAFAMTQALTALQTRPVITGINWYEGFDNPSVSGMVEISGQVRGGHEVVVRGFELRKNLNDSILEMDNSWSSDWGVNGSFLMKVSTWQQLLDEQGDVTILGKFNS